MVNVPAAGIRAYQQRRYTEAVAILVNLWRHHMIVPTAPIIIRPCKCGVLPGTTAHEGLDQRSDESLPCLDTARWMFACTRRYDERYLRQSAVLKIGEVLIEPHDMLEEPGGVKVAGIVKQRNPNNLRRAVATVRQIAIVKGRIVVLDIELPGNAALLKAVEDGRYIALPFRRQRFTTKTICACYPEHMIANTAT